MSTTELKHEGEKGQTKTITQERSSPPKTTPNLAQRKRKHNENRKEKTRTNNRDIEKYLKNNPKNRRRNRKRERKDQAQAVEGKLKTKHRKVLGQSEWKKPRNTKLHKI